MPLAVFISAGAPLGMGVAQLKEVMYNDDQEHTRLEMWLNGIATIGLLGLMGDIAGQIIEHPRHVVTSLLGPVYADMFKAANTVATGLSEGDIPGLAVELVEQAATPALRAPVGIATNIAGVDSPIVAERRAKEAKERIKALGL